MCSKNISAELREEAVNLGLCKEWESEWKDNTPPQELIDKYIKGIDFALQHHYPSNRYIRDNFELELLRKNNIIVDDERSLLNPRTAVILGKSKTKIRINGDSRSVIYIRDKSVADIYVKNSSFVIVHTFDNAHVTVEIEDNPNVLVLKHSTETIIKAPKGIKIKDEFDYLK